jgi:hypothetical protein
MDIMADLMATTRADPEGWKQQYDVNCRRPDEGFFPIVYGTERPWGSGHIAELHRSKFLHSPTTHKLVELALRSVRRRYGSMTKQAPPLGKKMS